jgi:hypothetical protein
LKIRIGRHERRPFAQAHPAASAAACALLLSGVIHIEISFTNLFTNLDMAARQLAMYNGELADNIGTFFETTDLHTRCA